MKTRVQKWGHSLALRIPKSFAEEIGIDNGSSVEVSLAEGKLVITPLPLARITLEQLLTRITDENRHQEIDTGAAVGNEGR